MSTTFQVAIPGIASVFVRARRLEPGLLLGELDRVRAVLLPAPSIPLTVKIPLRPGRLSVFELNHFGTRSLETFEVVFAARTLSLLPEPHRA